MTGAAGAVGAQGIQGLQGIQGIQGPTWTILNDNFNANGNLVINTDQPATITSTNAAWLTTGNGGTNPPTNFLGTTNAQHLVFKTNNVERARILSTKEFLVNSTTLIAPAGAGDAFSSFITAATNSWAINGVNTSTDGGGAYGSNTNTGNGYNAFEGVTAGTYSGVYGLHITATGTGYGLWGGTNSTAATAIGVYGKWGSTAGWAGLFTGDVGSTTGFFIVSDRKLKKDIDTIYDALTILRRLNPVQYNFDLQKYPNAGLREGKSFGFIADELEEVLPELIKNSQIDINGAKNDLSKSQNNADWQSFKTVDYISLVPILTKAVQEQQEIIDNQQQQIDLLQLQLNSVIKRIDELENK